MKKILISLIMCMGIYCTQAQVLTATAVAKAISWAVGASVTAYKACPTAEYTVEYKAKDGVAYVKLSSANEAILAAIVALENGAEYAHIRSQYPTVHPSCRDKRYTKSDIKYLRSRL
ncbi:MAG: hypothetical protein IJF01_06655 [Tidjanibacter sp.]|nr:hypothetical protein [Tidjanibacter sp.]